MGLYDNKLTKKVNAYHWKWRDASPRSKIKGKKLIYFNEQAMREVIKEKKMVKYIAYPTEWLKIKGGNDPGVLAVWQGEDKTVVAWVGGKN